MLADRRVKIVATIGPATGDRESLKKAIEAGMNVARLNFSHGEHKDHLKVIQSIRSVSRELKAPVAILQDLQGPKLRVGVFQNGFVYLKNDQMVTISTVAETGDESVIPTDFKELPKACKKGTKILLDDGLLELEVFSVTQTEVKAKVLYGGELSDRKGMNLPGAPLPVEAMTEKDLEDLEFGLDNGVDYVALSFVRKGSDIQRLQELISAKRPSTNVVAKIEMLEALDHLEDIIELSDGIMVARGDLAVEVGQSQLPGVQKRIINMCNHKSRPVITATQMLDSMVENPRPTRAEITDVANAVIDGSDALMLSAETASGRYPFKCIQTMHDIILEVELTGRYYYDLAMDREFLRVAEAIAASACLTAKKLNASAIVCLTTTGRTAKLISSFRPKARIVAVTHWLETLNRLELVWGIQTFGIKPYKSTDEAMTQIEEILVKYGLLDKGDRVVMTWGAPVIERAKTNSLRVFTIGSETPARLETSELPLRCRH